MNTSIGPIELELFASEAPVTVSNFLRYVDGGYYDGGTFYRTVTRDNDKGSPVIEVIQGGRGMSKINPFPSIIHESTRDTGIVHTDGTISMARTEQTLSEFFICIGDQPGLNYGGLRHADGLGFEAFGRVVEGMGIVRAIHSQSSDAPTDNEYAKGQLIEQRVEIISVKRKAGSDTSI